MLMPSLASLAAVRSVIWALVPVLESMFIWAFWSMRAMAMLVICPTGRPMARAFSVADWARAPSCWAALSASLCCWLSAALSAAS